MRRPVQVLRMAGGGSTGSPDELWWVGYKLLGVPPEYATVIPSRTHRIPSELRS